MAFASLAYQAMMRHRKRKIWLTSMNESKGSPTTDIGVDYKPELKAEENAKYELEASERRYEINGLDQRWEVDRVGQRHEMDGVLPKLEVAR